MERLTKSKKIKRQRKHGFRARMETHSGGKVIKKRRRKGRKRVSI